MLTSTLIMAGLALLCVALGYLKGPHQPTEGLRKAWQTTIQTLPLVLLAFIVGGMIETLIPQPTMQKWVGADSGLRGIVIGTLAGGFIPGGPYNALPIAASLMHAGSGIGTLVAFLTSWSLWSFARLPMDIGILGWRLSLIRLATTFFIPPLAGLLAKILFSGTKL